MKLYIDTFTITNCELTPIIVEALEKDGMYEVELYEHDVINGSARMYEAQFKVYKVCKGEKR